MKPKPHEEIKVRDPQRPPTKSCSADSSTIKAQSLEIVAATTAGADAAAAFVAFMREPAHRAVRTRGGFDAL